MKTPEDFNLLVEFIVGHGDDLGFTKFFWGECEPLPRDIQFYSEFARAIRNNALGIALPQDVGQVAVGFGSINSWLAFGSMPKLTHYLKALIRLGPPHANHVWLNTDCTHGQALPVGQFVEVPERITSWMDIQNVADQLHPVGESPLNQSRDYVLGFFLGIMIGDASKKKQGRGHRHFALVLGKKYETNLKIGEYTTLCAHALGLRMHRLKDLEPNEEKPHGFYQWVSQSSPLLDWFFRVGLGLKEGELTTYDPVRADWVFDAPVEFRLGLVQGFAESDGSVNISGQEVEFWIGPNWDWMMRLLETFGLKAFRTREAVAVSKTHARASFAVPVFSPYLQTIRFQRLRTMAAARTLEKKERLPPDLRKKIMSSARRGMSIPQIVEEIAANDKMLISFEAAQRWARKTGMYQPRGSKAAE